MGHSICLAFSLKQVPLPDVQAGYDLAAHALASFHLSDYSGQKGTASSLALHLAQQPSRAAAECSQTPCLAVQGVRNPGMPIKHLASSFSCHTPAAPLAGLHVEHSTLSFATWQQQATRDVLDRHTEQSVGWLPASATHRNLQGASTAGQQELEQQPSRHLSEQQLALPRAEECSTPLEALCCQLAKQSQGALQGYALLQCVGRHYHQQQLQPSLQGQAAPLVAQLQARLPVRLGQQGIPAESPFFPH